MATDNSTNNCSDSLLPLSEDYYASLSTGKLAFLYVDVALTVITLLIFAEECHFVIKTYKHFNITVKSLWLISIYPVFSVSALLAVLIPRASQLCDFVSTCYLSACFFQFSSLLLLYFGHVDRLVAAVQETGFSLRTRPCCCCCLCCPVLPPTRKSLRTVRLMIFQTAILMPIIQFVSAILWVDEKFQSSGIDFTESYIYLALFKLASTMTAIYGLIALHEATLPHLRTHNTAPKQRALLLVQVFFNIQSAILLLLARFDIPQCDGQFSSVFQMTQWQHMVLVVEMFILSLMARVYYRRPSVSLSLPSEWHHLALVVEMFLVSLMARVYYRRPLEVDATLEAQSGNLADIYTTVKGGAAADSADHAEFSAAATHTIQSDTKTLTASGNGQSAPEQANVMANQPSATADSADGGAVNQAYDEKM